MDPRLIVMIVGYGLGILLTITLGIFVLVKSKRNPLSVIFGLISLSIAVVEISIIGVIMARSPEQAYAFSFLNIANIYIVVFTAHWVMEAIGKVKSRKWPLIIIYGVGVLMTIFFILQPQSFLLSPTPKMYLNYYFVPGYLYTWMRVYFIFVSVYFLTELYLAYRASIDTMIKNRLIYVFSGIFFGMIFGHYAIFLVYDIQIDPIWSILFPFYTIPLAYSIVKYELMDTKIVAKRALLYALTVALVAFVLNIINSSNELLVENFPVVPSWLLPLAVSFVGSSVGFVIWLRLKESDELKNDFITIVTHKFRTPLTHIKWAVDSLKNQADESKEVKEGLDSISLAGESLIELTNTLMQTTNSEEIKDSPLLSKENVVDHIQKIINKYRAEIEKRHLDVMFNTKNNVPLILANSSSFKLIIQSLLENAITYNNERGSIFVDVFYKNDIITIVIRDTGIGIKYQDIPRIFSKFYRSSASIHIDTEGLGISLFIAKQISERNGWELNTYSEGENKGATFTLTIPVLNAKA